MRLAILALVLVSIAGFPPPGLQAQDAAAIVGRSSRVYRSLASLRAAALGIRVVDGELLADRQQILRTLLGGVDRARSHR